MYVQVNIVIYVLMMVCICANIVLDAIGLVRDWRRNKRRKQNEDCVCRGAEVTTDE